MASLIRFEPFAFDWVHCERAAAVLSNRLSLGPAGVAGGDGVSEPSSGRRLR